MSEIQWSGGYRMTGASGRDDGHVSDRVVRIRSLPSRNRLGGPCCMELGNMQYFGPYRAGRSAAWLARLNGVQEVGGSNPLAPIYKSRKLIRVCGSCRFGRTSVGGVELLSSLLFAGMRRVMGQSGRHASVFRDRRYGVKN